MAGDIIPTQYPTTFRTYILGAVRYALAQVQATLNLLADEVRQQALHALSYALDLPEAWPVTRDLLLVMAPKMEQAGHREDWIPYLERGIAAGEGRNEPEVIAQYQLYMGVLYRMVSQFAAAKSWLLASKANFAQGKNIVGQARVYNELAWIEHLQHRYGDAIQYAESALTLLDSDNPERGMSYRVLGMVAFYEKRFAEAEGCHRQSLAFFQHEKSPRRRAWALQNLAAALRDQQKFAEAIDCFQAARFILADMGDNYHWVIVVMNLGVTHYFEGRLQPALCCLLDAYQVATKLGDPLQLAMIYTNLGLVYFASGEHTQSEHSFLSAIALYQTLKDEGKRLNAADGLAMVYIAQKQYSKAILLLEASLAELSLLEGNLRYKYLYRSLNEHLLTAKNGKDLPDS